MPERLSGIKTITGPAESYHVIARRAKPDVAISCADVQVGTTFQEIATPLRARNDVVI